MRGSIILSTVFIRRSVRTQDRHIKCVCCCEPRSQTPENQGGPTQSTVGLLGGVPGSRRRKGALPGGAECQGGCRESQGPAGQHLLHPPAPRSNTCARTHIHRMTACVPAATTLTPCSCSENTVPFQCGLPACSMASEPALALTLSDRRGLGGAVGRISGQKRKLQSDVCTGALLVW